MAAADRLGQVLRELRRGRAASAIAARVLGDPGLPGSIEPGHLDVLEVLSGRDGLRMSELAAALRLDPSTVTRTMHRMEAAGLAHRAPERTDGRVVTAHLTPEGRRVHAIVTARRADLLEQALDRLPPDGREQFVELLEQFLRAVTDTATEGAGRPG